MIGQREIVILCGLHTNHMSTTMTSSEKQILTTAILTAKFCKIYELISTY